MSYHVKSLDSFITIKNTRKRKLSQTNNNNNNIENIRSKSPTSDDHKEPPN